MNSSTQMRFFGAILIGLCFLLPAVPVHGQGDSRADAERWIRQANSAFTRNNLAQALEFSRRAVLTDPTFARAHNWVGAVAGRMGKKSEACAAFSEALRLDAKGPEGASARRGLKKYGCLSVKPTPTPRPAPTRRPVADPPTIPYSYTLHRLPGHTRGVTSLAWNVTGTMLASGSLDKTVRLWEIPEATAGHVIQGHGDGVTAVAFHPQENILVTGSYDRTVRSWDTSTGKPLTSSSKVRPLTVNGEFAVNSVAFSPDGKLLSAGSGDLPRVYDVTEGETRKALTGHSAGVRAVAFSPDGKTLATGGYDGTVRLWEMPEGTAGRTLQTGGKAVLAVAWSPDSTRLAAASGSNVLIYDVAKGTLVRRLVGHKANVLSLAWSPDGKLLASGSFDHTVWLWLTDSGRAKWKLKGRQEAIYNAVAFAPDGKVLAGGSGGIDNLVYLWKMPALPAVQPEPPSEDTRADTATTPTPTTPPTATAPTAETAPEAEAAPATDAPPAAATPPAGDAE